VRLKTGDSCQHEASAANLEAIASKLTLQSVGLSSIASELDPASKISISEGSTEITLKINPDKLSLDANTEEGPNQIFNITDPALSILKFCLRLDLLSLNPDFDDTSSTVADTISVNFHETKFEISIDMTSTFQINDITTERTDATNIEEEATLDYSITAVLADPIESADIMAADPNTTLWKVADESYSVRNGEPLAVLICMENAPTDGGIQFKEVTSFKISNANNFAGDAAVDMTTEFGGMLLASNCDVNDDGIPCCIAQTMIQSAFFNDFGTEGGTTVLPVRIDGSTAMEFVSGGTILQRKLQFSGGGQPGDGQFELQANLESNKELNVAEESSANTNSVTKMTAASCMALILGGSLLFM